ncbi:MAG: hypothetical protein U9R25_08815 [Chloroflexota bacterium]|nr:hypothetical protein [Chloroflexota bacterium]
MESFFRKSSRLLLLILVVAAFLVTRDPDNDYAFGDSRYLLVTSQALLSSGTIRLDDYLDDPDDSRLVESGGHLYDYFPLGTSLLASPAVWLANLQGQDMTDIEQNKTLQHTLSALSAALIVLLIYLLSRCFAGYALSILFTAVFFFGSSIVATLGTALWTHNFALIITLFVLLMLVYDDRGKRPANPYLLGLLLFAAYLIRPILVMFDLAVLLYVLIWRRELFLKLSLTLLVCLAGFILYSWREFGQLLPPYYQPKRVSGAGSFWTALLGNLVSPGRGLLIYNPFLLLPLLVLPFVIKASIRQPLFWLAVGWLALHLVIISRFGHWWGGWSFGSRLTVDVIPALLLLTLLLTRAAIERTSVPWQRAGLGTFAALSVVAIFFNSYQGLYNFDTFLWHEWHGPEPVRQIEREAYILDWKYPQFLASSEMLVRRSEQYHRADGIQPFPLGQTILPDNTQVTFERWYDPEEDGNGQWRWSQGDWASIHFKVSRENMPRQGQMVLEIDASPFQPQEVTVILNGQTIGSIDQTQPSVFRFPFQASLLRKNPPRRHFNTLTFETPGAVSPISIDPTSTDDRIVGLALHRLQLIVP